MEAQINLKTIIFWMSAIILCGFFQKSYASAGTYSGSVSVTLSSTTGCATASYTFDQKIPNTSGWDQTTSNTCTITFPVGTDATTCTGGTYYGSAIGAMTKTATSISFTCPVAVSKNTTFIIVLNGISNGDNLSGECTVTCGNSSGFDNTAPAGSYSFTTTACPLEITIGTGTSTTSAPSPYRGNWWSAREQYIITASELISQGLYAGCTLTSLSFNVSSKASSQPFTGYTISLGHTTASSFSTATFLAPSFTAVYNGNYTSSTGWNLHTFSTGFVWNGSDNLVVQVCFSNSSYTSDDVVYCTSNTNTVCYAEMDASGGCTFSGESLSSSRPNMKFSYTAGPNCSGTPAGGTTSASNATICNTESSILTLSGAEAGNGISHQWQESSDNSSWTDISGETSLTYNASPSSDTYYRCVTTCSFSSSSSNSTSTLVEVINCSVIGTGTSTSSYYPFYTYYAYSRSAALYTAAEVGTLPTLLTTLGWDISTATTENVPVKIYLKTTTETTVATDTWANMIAGATLVYDATVQFTPTGWKTFDITDFSYCGDNLLVLCEANMSSSPYVYTYFRYTSTGSYQNEYWYGSSVPTGTGTRTYNRPNIKIGKATAPSMTYTSSTVTQNNTSDVNVNTTDQEVIGIEVVTSGCSSALTASSFTVNITGTTLASDISNLKLWTTGTNSTFSTATQLGATVASPSGTHVISGGANMPYTLSGGTEYFWVTYDVPTGATVDNYIDAQCTSITIGGTPRTPTVTAPVGNRKIVDVSTIGSGTSTTYYSPYYTYYAYSRSAALYTEAEVGSTPTLLKSLAWNVSTSTTENVPVKIYLKTTTETTVASDTWANMIAGATLVYDGTVQFTPTGWKLFDITDFPYCGDNLLVLCESNMSSSPWVYTYFTYTSTASYQTEYWYGSSIPTGTGSRTYSRPNIKIYKDVATVCSGTPTAGTANPNPSSMCVGESSLLTVTGSSEVCGLTYQWQSSPDNSAWSDISGATLSSYTAYPSSSTYYRRMISCGANTVYTPGVQIVVDGPSYAPIGYSTSFESNWLSRCDTREIPDDYWVADPVTGDNSWRRHDNETEGAWSSTSGIYSPVSSDGSRSARFHSWSTSDIGTLDLYIDMSTQSGTKTLEFDYINTNGSDVLDILLSTDNGATFPTTLLNLTTAGTWTTYYADIASNSATTVIRFRAEGDGGSTDIGVDRLVINPPCSGMPTAGTAVSDISDFCNAGSPVLSLSGYTIAGDINIQWQSSPDGSSWSDISGAATNTYAVSPAITQTTYYRAAVACSDDVAYSNTVTVTNTAQQITGTNSPVTATCNSAANLTATATGGTISWYTSATGGTAVATGGSYNPTVTANTTFYCSAGDGGATSSVGKGAWNSGDGYNTASGRGLRFDALSDFTLVSVEVYVQTAGSDVTIQLQDNTGNPIGTDVTATSLPAGLNVITLNLSIPTGTGYRLIKTNSASLGRCTSGLSFPYTQAGICSITASEYWGADVDYYYYFYNWVLSTACESSPRTPVDVVVSGGVSVPACSANPSPTDGETDVCPVSASLAWDASIGSCQTATGYKLYLGTDAGATNIHNGTDIGNVTSYNLGTLGATTTYYWKIVPYNSAGDATGCSIWDFTTAANPGAICETNMGSGVISVGSLPYSSGSGTTQGSGNELTSSNTVYCGSSSYLGGEDQVFVFTPATSGSITISLTSSGSYTGLMLYDGCPLTGTTCGATEGNCVEYTTGSSGNKTLSTCVTAGITYYLVLDSYPAPTYNAYSDLTISAPTGSVASNDLPCNATALTLGSQTSGNNACTGSSLEPTVPSCWYSGEVNAVWYTVVCPASGELTIQTTLGTLTNTQIAVYSGTCSSLTLVSGGCNVNSSGCGSSNASYLDLTGLTPGATYYIRVDGAYDYIGSFDIVAVDGSGSLPTTLGQDCSAALPTCATALNVADPGYSGTGSICDFDGSDDCTGGDRAAVFYNISIASAGQLMFDIVPNDYSGGYPGDGTDYDYILWKTAGSGTLATCESIQTNSSIGLVACNYSYIDVTGLYTGGNAPSAYGSGFDDAYEAPITVAAGDEYLLWISNFSLSTSGFTIDYANSTPSANIINIAPVPTLIAWTGAVSTTWNLADNWGGCGVPNTCATSVVIPAYQPTMPVISTDVSVNDLTINSGATLTINTGKTLTICGNFTNNGTLTVNGTGRVIFNGTTPQICTNNSGTLTIPNVTINNSGGGVTLAGSSGNMVVTSSLTLTEGVLYTSSSALLIMNAGTSLSPSTGGTSTSYVDGPMQKIGNTAFVFPLGDGTRWARLAINPFASSSTFQAEYFATPYSTLTPMDPSQGTAILDHVSSLEYWQLDRVAGTGTPMVTLYWENSMQSGIYLCADYQDLSVAKWTGTCWTNLNTTGATITGACNPGAGTIRTQAPVTTFSPFTFGSRKAPEVNPLPVELLSFRGRKEGNKNMLEWETASEINNDYFLLLRSSDGENYEEFAQISGYGNSREVNFYDHVDHHPYNPVTYYKLKQVDTDGFYSYSDVISIRESNEMEQAQLLELYPNPATTKVNIVLFSPSEGLVDLTLMDMYGRVVYSEKVEVEQGRDVLVTDISALSKGVYMAKITFENADFTGLKRFIKK